MDAKAARAAPAIAEHDPHVEQFPDRLSVSLTSDLPTVQAGDAMPGDLACGIEVAP